MLTSNCTARRFNAALTGEPEKTIVTSTGPFIVAWNFRQVKAGNIHNYTLRRFSDDVVADNFKFGGDREIVRRSCSLRMRGVIADGRGLASAYLWQSADVDLHSLRL